MGALRIRRLPAIARGACWALLAAVAGGAAAFDNAELNARVQIAAATLADAVVVDCQLPGRLQRLGGMRTYLSPGALTRLPAIDCRTRGGEYTVGDLASGTLSLERWLPLAEQGNLEAQYYVARIYANGMAGVQVDYARAAEWYKRAADKKYAPAMQELGYLYEQGLGVKQDLLLALNLQREASGLGADLDYAWKLTAAKDEAAKQVAALTDRLEAANADVETLRGQLAQASDRVLQGRAELAREQNRLVDLRAALADARRGGTADNGARVKQLQDDLAAKERELEQQRATLATLASKTTDQESALSAQLAASQAATSQLNQLLVAGQNENQALRARLVQSEQRLQQSQGELSALRLDFRKAADSLAARSEELRLIRARGSDNGPALLAAQQREIDRQQGQVKSLQDEITRLRHEAGAAGSSATDAAARDKALQANLVALQARYDEQERQLQAQRAEYARLQTQSKEERAAVVKQMSDQLAASAAALEERQRRIASLQADTGQLRDALARERSQRGGDVAAATDDARRARDALRAAQEKIAEQREKLEQMQMETAAQQVALVRERENLEQQLAQGQRASQQKTMVLEAELRDKEAQVAMSQKRVADLQQHITTLEKALTAEKQPSMLASNVSYRTPQAVEGGSSGPAALLQMVRGMGPANYHALIIGNGNYRFMGSLITPAADARAVADVLTTRYGFDVNLLLDATRDQIMRALNQYARTLTDADRLLIYYAGHGGAKFGPPERAFWLGVDADPDLPSTWLSAQTISDAIGMIQARHVLLVADSCFSSSITHTQTTTVARSFNEKRAEIEWQRQARTVLTSGQNEPVVDGSSADRRHSLFAEQFITVLRQNDILMTGEMVAYEIGSRLASSAARTGLKQTPTYSVLQDPNHRNGDFFFAPVSGSISVASTTP